MTHKTFYQAAAMEVAGGHVDEALWIKVNAEMPGADEKSRRAKYIALRAREIAHGSMRATAKRLKQPLRSALLTTLVIALVIVVISAVFM